MATPFRLKRSAVSGKRPALADLQLGELALNTNNASLFAKRDTGGVGIGTTVTLLTPWVENFGGASIFYENSVGIGTTNPTSTLTVIGTGASISQLFVTGVSTFAGITTVTGETLFTNQLSVSGLSTFAGITTVTGSTLFSKQLNVSGVSTFASLVNFNGGVDISGHLEIDNAIISGVTTFTNTTNNTLGNPNTGAVQIDGGLGVEKNVTVGAGLSVAGDFGVNGQSLFVGIVTFQGGIIKLGDSDTDDINVGGEFTSSLIPNTDDTYDLGTTSKQWRNIYINGIADVDDLNVSGVTTTSLLNVGVGGTIITSNNTPRVGINSTSPAYTLDVGGVINSSTDVRINGTSVLTSAANDAVALAIALG